MRIALLQTRVYTEKRVNIENARRYAEYASENGAELAVLPEMFTCPYSTDCFERYAEEKGEETYESLSTMAKENKIVIVGGSFPERDGDKIYNSSFVFDTDGKQIALHRKVHLFDIDIKGKQKFKESDVFSPGDKITLFDVLGHRFGLAICFDIRFEEMFRYMALKGAEAVFVPAAFNMTTGPMHWELSFRMRAVDNQLFMVGTAPSRDKNGVYISYANSLVCDPWGNVIKNAGTEPCVEFAEINFEDIGSIREQLPILSSRRPDLYVI